MSGDKGRHRKRKRVDTEDHGDGPGPQPSGTHDVSRDSRAQPSGGLFACHCSGEFAAGMALTLLAMRTAIYKQSRIS